MSSFLPVLHCGVSFLILFTAFNGAANLETKAMADLGYANLGFYSLATLYFVFALSAFFSVSILQRIGPKMCLLFGSLTYTLYLLANLVPILSKGNS